MTSNKWIEVVQVRTVIRDKNILKSTLNELTDAVKNIGSNDTIYVFTRELINTDICIVLFHDSPKQKTGESATGLQLASAMREFGVVHHSVWHEWPAEG